MSEQAHDSQQISVMIPVKRRRECHPQVVWSECPLEDLLTGEPGLFPCLIRIKQTSGVVLKQEGVSWLNVGITQQ